jgi:hypothetical protein
MKKEDIYVEINNEEDRLRAIQILEKAVEKIYPREDAMKFSYVHNSLVKHNNGWLINTMQAGRTKITLFELDVLLTPKSTDTLIEDFKQQMRDKGLEVSVVIEKEIINPDDVVMYWDKNDYERILSKKRYVNAKWDNIVKVTDPHILKFLNL